MKVKARQPSQKAQAKNHSSKTSMEDMCVLLVNMPLERKTTSTDADSAKPET